MCFEKELPKTKKYKNNESHDGEDVTNADFERFKSGIGSKRSYEENIYPFQIYGLKKEITSDLAHFYKSNNGI
jgi:hypothetical protein